MRDIPNHYWNTLRFIVENNIKAVTDQEIIKNVMKVYKDESYKIGDMLNRYMLYFFIIYASGILITEIFNMKSKFNNMKNIRFNKMCINALKEIQNEIPEEGKIIS
ncbi:hypothetical protein RBU61_08365 [Tissierella sp. MB52-C2]|uniref:hypothetical protein n=1 Tax=Tissierella sp. MB52-C2 TaxID=3070999 RepID=UPI00280AF947|nr:hypothetical protein [Tissierella sp. MB52-C2]WMM26678.1 hypothetical protein RBU61_08365 [Tissierella sp. MB52-C2]